MAEPQIFHRLDLVHKALLTSKAAELEVGSFQVGNGSVIPLPDIHRVTPGLFRALGSMGAALVG